MEEGLNATPTNLAENAIIFNVTGLDVPVLELRQNGDIMVKGNLVENDTDNFTFPKPATNSFELAKVYTGLTPLIINV